MPAVAFVEFSYFHRMALLLDVISKITLQMHMVYRASKGVFAQSCYYLHSINSFKVDPQAKERA